MPRGRSSSSYSSSDEDDEEVLFKKAPSGRTSNTRQERVANDSDETTDEVSTGWVQDAMPCRTQTRHSHWPTHYATLANLPASLCRTIHCTPHPRRLDPSTGSHVPPLPVRQVPAADRAQHESTVMS
jgi:hypothetical protein